MRKLDLMDVNSRGDADFRSLDEAEKDLYVLLLFFTLRDMEGITHFYSYHPRHVPRLLKLLEAAGAPNARAVAELSEFLRGKAGGTWSGKKLDAYFCSMAEDDNARINEWEREYAEQTEQMWDRVREYVRRSHGVDFD